MMPEFYYVREGLVINLNFIVLVEDRRKYYESLPDNEFCVAHIRNNETFVVEILAQAGGASLSPYGLRKQILNLSPQEGTALIEEMMRYRIAVK